MDVCSKMGFSIEMADSPFCSDVLNKTALSRLPD
jgi:hypothetical protein